MNLSQTRYKRRKFFTIGWMCFILIILTTLLAECQVMRDSLPKKGSYLYYGPLEIEDNSFLLEEAFNQPSGVIQYISNFVMDDFHNADFIYSFTQEIPLKDTKHQFSYTVFYDALKSGRGYANGFGDLFLSYRPLLLDERDWAMVIPRFTLIVPTGKAKDGLGEGGWGTQFNLAVTKRLSASVVIHYNVGYTYISSVDKYTSTSTGDKILTYENDLNFINVGGSIIWHPVKKINLLFEYTSNFGGAIQDNGQVSRSHIATFNPGFRFCIDNNKMQIVPGLSVPVVFEDAQFLSKGFFFYLSFEPDYLSFYKAKNK